MNNSRKFKLFPKTRKVDLLMLVIRVKLRTKRIFLLYDFTANRLARAHFTTKFTNVIVAQLQCGETSRRTGDKVARVIDARKGMRDSQDA